MNKICIFAKNKKTYFINRLIEEVGQGVELFDPWSDFNLPESDVYFSRTTGIHHSDLDLLIMGSLPPGKVINPVVALNRFRSKKNQWLWFEEENFPCLPWLSLKGIDPILAEKFCRLYPEVLVKPDLGQGGWGIEVLDSTGLLNFIKKKKKAQDEDYLIQPFVKNANEYRYFFLQGEDPIVLQRKARSGVTANFKQEGEATLSELPHEFQEVIARLAVKSGALYGAIDLLIEGTHLHILELNTVPGIEQLENISRQNIMGKILKSLVKNQ